MRHALAICVALWASAVAAEVNVYPPDGQAVGIVTSQTEGRWMVFRAAPFGVVQSKPCTVGGVNGCMWFAESGVFTAVLVPSDQTAPFEFGTVNLGPNPDPDPDPDPDPGPDPIPPPPPGKRLVLVVEEKDNRTPEQALIYQQLKSYAASKNHVWRLLDDDTVDEDGRPVERLERYLKWFTEEGIALPALVVAVTVDGKEQAWATTVPNDSQAAIDWIKKWGG